MFHFLFGCGIISTTLYFTSRSSTMSPFFTSYIALRLSSWVLFSLCCDNWPQEKFLLVDQKEHGIFSYISVFSSTLLHRFVIEENRKILQVIKSYLLTMLWDVQEYKNPVFYKNLFELLRDFSHLQKTQLL